jgi:predicted small integral membrane protein
MQPTTGLGWMAWTWQTAAFFGVIALLLMIMAIWEWRVPGGAPRRGVLGLRTTRGDRCSFAVVRRLPASAVAGLVPVPV